MALDLKDIHFPDPIGWFPPAIGWWIVLIFTLIALFLSWILYRAITRKTAKKTALKILNNLKNNPNFNDFEKLKQLSILLRRTAISGQNRAETASLTGDNWLKFLDKDLKNKPFTTGVGRVFAEAQYQPNQSVDIVPLFELCEEWIKSRKTSSRPV